MNSVPPAPTDDELRDLLRECLRHVESQAASRLCKA